MNILFFTEIIPFPVRGGEKLRSYGLLRILSRTFDKVIAVIGQTNNKAYLDTSFENIEFHEFDFNSILPRNKYLYCLKSFTRNKQLIGVFERILSENTIDIVFLDYHYFGQYIRYFKSIGIPVIYGTHNVQSKITYQLPSITFLNKLSNMLRYSAFVIHEWYFFRKADALIAVSENDYNYYKRYIAENKVFIIPNFLIEDDYSLTNIEKKDYIIMTANFEVFQNRAGLEWFIENIWTNEVFENSKLLLAGMGSDVALDRINQKRIFRNIEALGSVDDLKPYVASAKVAVVPLLHGSGTRLKCIESMALKTQLVSTSKGAEGLEHEGSIVIADTPVQFTKHLLDVLKGEIDYTDKAYDIFIHKYSSAPNQKVFEKMIKQVSV
jgi:polysaccharide biosynthesis protein PslH